MTPLAELFVDEAIEEAGKTGEVTGPEVLAAMRKKLGREPQWEEIGAFLGVDPRKYKPWPVEEDCPGCDQHRDSDQHRFGCSVRGARASQRILGATLTPDGKMLVKDPTYDP